MGRGKQVKRLFIFALVIALAGCRTVPDVFVTPETDAAIVETADAIDAISGAAETLDTVVQGLNAGDTLTVEQVETIKTATATIKASAVEAKTSNDNVKEFHEKDNVAANVIVTDYHEVKNDNRQLKTALFAIVSGLVIALAAIWFFRK